MLCFYRTQSFLFFDGKIIFYLFPFFSDLETFTKKNFRIKKLNYDADFCLRPCLLKLVEQYLKHLSLGNFLWHVAEKTFFLHNIWDWEHKKNAHKNCLMTSHLRFERHLCGIFSLNLNLNQSIPTPKVASISLQHAIQKKICDSFSSR